MDMFKFYDKYGKDIGCLNTLVNMVYSVVSSHSRLAKANSVDRGLLCLPFSYSFLGTLSDSQLNLIQVWINMIMNKEVQIFG